MFRRDRAVQYLRDFQERPLPPAVARELAVPETGRIVSVIGPRRCGKTYYFFQMMRTLLERGVPKEQLLYLNFEDTRLGDARYAEIEELLRLHHEIHPGTNGRGLYIFLDEPQTVAGWERAVRSMHDAGAGRLFVTGSSARLLGREISTSLRGRTLTFLLLPFAFREFLAARRWYPASFPHLSSSEEARMKSLLREYLTVGGFPEVVSEPDAPARQRIMKEYFDLVMYRDIVERYGIKNLAVVRFLLRHLFSAYSKELSVHKLFNSLKSQGMKVSKKTLYNYLCYIEDALAVFLVRGWAPSARARETTMPKAYLADTGFAGLSDGFPGNAGRVMENMAFLELKRRQNADPLLEVYCWRGSNGREVDFVLRRGARVAGLVQCCYSLDDPDTKEREVRSLLAAGRELGCRDLTVLTWDHEAVERYGGKRVSFVPLWKWAGGPTGGSA